VILIELLEVPPGADEAVLAARSAGPTTTLYRALRDDVDFRFVAVAQGGDPGSEVPFPSHAALYEVVREDGRPDVAGGVRLINPFEVPPGEDERFLAGWEAARATLNRQQGYLGTRLHRATGEADFRFVNVAGWSSPLMFARALDRPEFREAAAAIPFRSHPALYTAVPG
jgi:heme oxygenase (mycobilin-producing)